jgi:hypothetical protein
MSVKRRWLVAGPALAALLVASTAKAAEPTKEQCISANESAQALRQAGKLQDARSMLSVCMAQSCPGPVREDCAQRLDEVQRAIPTVVFEMRDTAGRDLTGVNLTIDARPVGAPGVIALPLDPGPHTFRFEVAGAPPVDKSIVLREAEKDRLVAVVIERPAIGSRFRPRPGEAGDVPSASAASGEEPSRPGSGDAQRLAGWIAGGLGVATMGVGVALGLVAKSSYDSAPGCSGTQCRSPTGFDQSNSAIGTGNAATGVFVAGAVVTGAGVVLWLTAPKAPSTGATSVSLTPGGVVARGTF